MFQAFVMSAPLTEDNMDTSQAQTKEQKGHRLLFLKEFRLFYPNVIHQRMLGD
jgi:hypothetical protein